MTIADPMLLSPPPAARTSGREPMWDLLQLFPGRGEWTDADYFSLNASPFKVT